MKKQPPQYLYGSLALIVIVVAGIFLYVKKDATKEISTDILIPDGEVETALFANGCFWCVEADLQKVKGVYSVESGYANGITANPTYDDYAQNGHREVVEVRYNPDIVSYANLVEHILKHGDPTDSGGSFGDRGPGYAPAIYYASVEQKGIIEKVIARVNSLGVFPQIIDIDILASTTFWIAEEYHQDYAQKKPLRYLYYRNGSGRDDFIKKYWGDTAGDFTVTEKPASKTKPTQPVDAAFWESYIKPSDDIIRNQLTTIQFEVTQKDGTEAPFKNEYDANKEAGIYVDILSGEPMFSSKDKFDSETGWPSFVKPISPTVIITKEDRSLFLGTRIEVRSVYADNHIGHVFEDGPVDRGGFRWCMNSAAMKFIPESQMEASGYADFLQYVN